MPPGHTSGGSGTPDRSATTDHVYEDSPWSPRALALGYKVFTRFGGFSPTIDGTCRTFACDRI
jgi:hypothetical protein